MASGETLRVDGLQEFVTACDHAGKETKSLVRAELRGVGDIVRNDAVRRLSPISARSAMGYRTRVSRHSVVVVQSLKKSVIPTQAPPHLGAVPDDQDPAARPDSERAAGRAGDGRSNRPCLRPLRGQRLMDHLTVDGVAPYDGRYEFDLRGSAFTVREWGWIKRHSGYLPLTMWDGLRGSDAELLAVFAIIALVRAGKVDRDDVPQVWERFTESSREAVRLELEASEDDDVEDPPESSNGNDSSSGAGSSRSSEALTEILPVSGTPASATSGSHPATVSGS